MFWIANFPKLNDEKCELTCTGHTKRLAKVDDFELLIGGVTLNRHHAVGI